MESDSIPFLLVTANVGSVFEDPSRLLTSWITEFVSKVTQLKPNFLALHLQEVGGKTYEKSMEYVQEFIKMLCEAEELADYTRVRIYLDEDYTSAEHFTALGNLYFVHKSLNTVKIWNFLTHEWELADGKSIHTGNIEAVATKEKSKFPQHFFPECKWSRKGFLRTRWELNGTVIDLVNIHLFHDASNLAAAEGFPSVYCKTRRRALVHTLERFHKDTTNGLAPYFVFGDFNFRCDQEGVIKKLTEDLIAHRVQHTKNDNTKVQYRNSDGDNVLTVGKKEFTHADHQTKFKESWLQQFDRELEPLREVLVEYPITFPPSYPYEEDPEMPKSYMSTRCPAWCDRILMSPSARDLLFDDAFSANDYNIIGENICMGDHKPIYLSISIKTLQGTYRPYCYCEHGSRPSPPSPPPPQTQRLPLLIDLDRTNLDVQKDFFKIDALSSSFYANNTYCLYSSNEFTKILLECRKLERAMLCNNKTNSIFISKNLADNNSLMKYSNEQNISSNDGSAINEEYNKNSNLHKNDDTKPPRRIPSISINLTDTAENINVCLCSIYPTTKSENLQFIDAEDDVISRRRANDCDIDADDDDDQIDGSICPECRNIIKKQSTEHRCTLISKRLILSNNIIVNRIDTHYLSTGYTDMRVEPYTPESAESHSPYPEFSYCEFKNQSDLGMTMPKKTAHSDDPKIAHFNNVVQTNFNCNNIVATSKDDDDFGDRLSGKDHIGSGKSGIVSNSSATNLRGVVSPKQLKSRLENLQRTSLNSDLDVGSSDDDKKKNLKNIKESNNGFKSKCCLKSCCCCNIL